MRADPSSTLTDDVATPAPVHHGGNLASAAARFPDAPRPWIDLSTGINPHAYPVGTIDADAWHRLPDPQSLAGLERVAAEAYTVPAHGYVVAAPGTQVLIGLLARLLPARHVAVLGFGYQEHPVVWRAAGAQVRIVESLDELAGADVAVVVNPNNPDGRMVEPAALASLAGRLTRKGATLVVDEAFMDVMEPRLSLVPMLPGAGAVVLRSFGKTFGLAGLRLGFAVAEAGLAEQLRAALGPWPVSGPAIAVATRALRDTAWRHDMVAALRIEASRLDALLVDAGFRLLGGTPLFRLVACADADAWFERLGRAGVLVRAFPARPGWLRFGLPGDAEAWNRLRRAVSS